MSHLSPKPSKNAAVLLNIFEDLIRHQLQDVSIPLREGAAGPAAGGPAAGLAAGPPHRRDRVLRPDAERPEMFLGTQL